MIGNKKIYTAPSEVERVSILNLPLTFRDKDENHPTGRCCLVMRTAETKGKGNGAKANFIYNVLNHNVDCGFIPLQLGEVIKKYKTGIPKDNRIFDVEIDPEGKFVLLGESKAARLGEDVQPLKKITIGEIEFWVYKLYLHRYDRSKDFESEFWEVQIQNEYLDTFFLPGDTDVEKFLYQMQNSGDAHAFEIQKEIYRRYTGAVKVSDLSERATASRELLVHLAEVCNREGTKKYGYNKLGVFAGWLRFYNEVRLDYTPTKFDCLVGNQALKFQEILSIFV